MRFERLFKSDEGQSSQRLSYTGGREYVTCTAAVPCVSAPKSLLPEELDQLFRGYLGTTSPHRPSYSNVF